MFQMLIFARKKADISWDEFVDRYESGHVRLVDELVATGVHAPMLSYRRHYLLRDHPVSTAASDPNYDVVVEASFEDADEFTRTWENIKKDPTTSDRLNQDFESFLDPNSLRYMVVDVRTGGGEANSEP